MKIAAALILLSAFAAAQTASPKLSALDIARADYLAACQDEAQINQLGTQPLGEVLQQIAGVRNVRQWAPVVARLHALGVPAVFQFGTLPPAPADLRSTAYLRRVRDTLAQLGDPTATAATEAEAAVQVEVALSRPRGPVTPLTPLDLRRLAPNFDWRAYFAAAGGPPAALAGEADYFQALNGDLLTLPLESWTSYLRWQWVRATAPLLPAPFAQAAGAAPVRGAQCAATGNQFPDGAYLAAGIRRDDFFGDTLRLRAAVLKSSSSHGGR